MILRLYAEPVVPGETVAHCEAAEQIVRPDSPHYAESEHSQGNTVGEERFVVDEPFLLCEAKHLASNVADHGSNDYAQ